MIWMCHDYDMSISDGQRQTKVKTKSNIPKAK